MTTKDNFHLLEIAGLLIYNNKCKEHHRRWFRKVHELWSTTIGNDC